MSELVKKYLIKKTNNTYVQFFRYFISGGTAFMVYIVILFILTEYFNIFHLTSLVMAYAIAIIINFVISKFFVFQSKKEKYSSQFYKFFIVALVGLALQFLIVYVGTEYLYIKYLFVNIIASAFIYLFSFSLNKLITFKNDHHGNY